MSAIQVDMFEVQLGASMLIQARRGRAVVSVLADGGIRAAGYQPDHVLRKLPAAMDAFSPGRRRIDLMVGTHFDRDHLVGLVPIIEDPSVEIGEAWMPPVLDDRVPPPRNRGLQADDFLGRRMWNEGTDFVRSYMAAKLRDCNEFTTLREGPPERGHGRDRQRARAHMQVDEYEAALEEHVRDSAVALDHAGGRPDDPVRTPGAGGTVTARSRADLPERGVGGLPRAGAAATLDYLRYGAAMDAINALALDRVIGALRTRKVPTSFRTIRDGEPRALAWNGSRHRFARGGTSTIGLTVLGPSAGLVRKHAERLPLGHYARTALERVRPIAWLTPSNQLSYVIRFDAGDQRILLTGDAGMVDFRRDRRRWHPRLVTALSDLDVVQVAHHGGHNAYFYEALLEAPARTKATDEFYLLSHAEHDRHRPSKAFEDFLDDREVQGLSARLLFTSEPDKQRVSGYRDLIEPVVGTPGTVGDIRLEFARRWDVTAHAVAVPAITP